MSKKWFQNKKGSPDFFVQELGAVWGFKPNL